MKNRLKVLSVMMLLGMMIFNVLGCGGISTPSKSSPSDEEVLKAINNSGLFSGGVEKYVLKSPIEVTERGAQNRDGSWPAKVKITYVSMAHGHESAPVEKTALFRIYPSKDSSGKTVWKAVVGS